MLTQQNQESPDMSSDFCFNWNINIILQSKTHTFSVN